MKVETEECTMTELHLPTEMYITEPDGDGHTATYCTMRQIVLHAIGLDRPDARVYHRRGRAFYKPYRNYFGTYLDDYPWPALCEAGYAEHGEIFRYRGSSKDATTYHLTRKGLDWLEAEIDIHIYDCD